MRWLLIFLVIMLKLQRVISSTSTALQEHKNMEESADEGIQITAMSKLARGGGGSRGGFHGGSSGFKGGGSGVEGGDSGNGRGSNSGRGRGYGAVGGAGIFGAGTAGAAAGASHRRNHTNHGSASPTAPFTFTLLSSLLGLGIFLVNS